jgi:pimeloyl-ACP methyl ester carboxylesterase
VEANGVEFGLLEAGSGPLALCLHLEPGSRMDVVAGAGHFPHLEQPRTVNERILAWVDV